MKKFILFLTVIASLSPQFCYALTVSRVIDGDTLVLSDRTKVRLIGIDTPEYHPSRKLNLDAERTMQDKATIRALGKKSSRFTESLVLGKKVTLKYDRQKKDKYRRTLAYVYLQDRTFVNLKIIKEGYANAYTKYPFKYSSEFVNAEKQARRKRVGLWK